MWTVLDNKGNFFFKRLLLCSTNKICLQTINVSCNSLKKVFILWVLNTKHVFVPCLSFMKKSHCPMPVYTGSIIVINFVWSLGIKYTIFAHLSLIWTEARGFITPLVSSPFVIPIITTFRNTFAFLFGLSRIFFSFPVHIWR